MEAHIPGSSREIAAELNWHEYFMAQAVLASKRSKDPITKVEVCLVGPEGNSIGVGYNGHPKVKKHLQNDQEYPWTKDKDDWSKNKHMFVCHAELNAMAHCSGQAKGAVMFVTLFPCNECAKIITQFELKQVFYLAKKEKTGLFADGGLEASEKILATSNVIMTEHRPFMKLKYGEEWEPKKITITL